MTNFIKNIQFVNACNLQRGDVITFLSIQKHNDNKPLNTRAFIVNAAQYHQTDNNMVYSLTPLVYPQDSSLGDTSAMNQFNIDVPSDLNQYLNNKLLSSDDVKFQFK